MAKWGEGDDRWKVAEMGEQGRNVNSWHWEESNVLPWCEKRLNEILNDVELVNEKDLKVVTEGKVKVSGDAIINRRKGKVIPAYELDMSVGWKAIKQGGENDGETWTGEIKSPYISEENHDEDPEVQVTVKTAGAEAEKIRNLIVKHGRPVMYVKLAEFVKELRAGGPSGKSDVMGNEGKKSAGSSGVHGADEARARALEKSSSKIEKRSLEIVEHYYASMKDIYECFTDPGRVRAYTGSVAQIEPTEGGAISMFGGSIEGTFRKLEPYSRLEMDWRFSTWPDGAISKVCIQLEEKDKGSVTLTLKQDEIPETDRFGNHDVVNMTQAGWKQQMLHRMKQVFGYGI